ncbi:MAG: hypothetical protein MI824_13290 [Hyphomicrobiales bacterium]|nr:hypothetical protein [Hyphomicrobiales bacterium]
MRDDRSEHGLDALTDAELKGLADRGQPRGSPALPYVLMAAPVCAVAGLVIWLERGMHPFAMVTLALAAAAFLWLAWEFRTLARSAGDAALVREELARRSGGRTLEQTHPAAQGLSRLSTERIRGELAELERSERRGLVRSALAVFEPDDVMATGVVVVLLTPIALLLVAPLRLAATLAAVGAVLVPARIVGVLWARRFSERRLAAEARVRLLRRELARRSARAILSSGSDT